MSKKKSSNWENIADALWEGPLAIEALLIAIPYVILTTIGTALKVILTSIISVLTLNKTWKLSEIWNKKNLEKNIADPWNCLTSIVVIILLLVML